MSRRSRVIAALLALAVVGGVIHASPASAESSSVIFVVDVSGSMSGTPLTQAKTALNQAVAALPAGTNAGLRAYEGSCGDGGDLLIPVGPVDAQQFTSAIDSLQAGGGTPTPDALTAAASDLPSSGDRTVVLISDGQSGCGDPCPVAASLATSLGVGFRVHTVGFQASATAGSELECIARVTGGTYVPVTDGDQLGQVLGGLVGNRTYDNYVALGDSYSSGEGTRNYDSGTGSKVQGREGCHRGPEAWPRKLQAIDTNRIKVITHAACSGAMIKDVVERQQKATESVTYSTKGLCRFLVLLHCFGSVMPPRQIDRLNADTDLVTVSIGGNNLGFAGYIESCVRFMNGCQQFPDHRDAHAMCQESYSCSIALMNDPRGTSRELRGSDKEKVINYLMDHIARDIQYTVIPSIKNHAPNARVVFVGYPDLFPSGSEKIVTCGWFSSGEQDLTARLFDRLDASIRRAVESAGAEYVSTADTTNGRELCTSDPWFVPVASRGSFGAREQAHPTSPAQQKMAEAVEATLFG